MKVKKKRKIGSNFGIYTNQRNHWTIILIMVFSKLHLNNMSEAAVTVRVRKFMRNPLLKRRQMVGCKFWGITSRPLKFFTPSVLLSPRKTLRTFFARSTTLLTIRLWSSSASRLLSVLCFVDLNKLLGGGRSTGFALIYDSVEDVKKFEAKYRLARVICSNMF